MRKNTKFIKRTLSAFMVATLTIALVGCGNASEDVVEDVSEEIVQEEMVETEVAANVEVPTEVVEEETEESTEEESTEESAKKEETEKKKNEESKTVAKNENSGSTTTAPVQGNGHENPEYTTPAYEGVSYFTNTQTPMHLVKETTLTLVNGDDKYYYVVDSFNTYALNEYLTNGDAGRWTNIPHGDEWDAWYEIECGRATFVDGVYTPVSGNGDFLQMNNYLNIDGHGGPAPGLNNPITRHPEGGGCYYFNYNIDYRYASTEFRFWDREKLALITPDYLGVENLLYNAMFSDTVYFGANADQPEYVGNTKIEYLGKQADCEFSYIFRISQR